MGSIYSQEKFQSKIVSQYTDVIGEKLGGKVLSFSDQWFADAENLIKPKAPIRDATRFTYAGAWYDGWETRRHNESEFDYVVFKLGVSSANIIGCEIDTAFFNGNHAPFISVDGLQNYENDETPDDKWEEIIPKFECGPSQKHFFVRDEITSKNYTHIRLKMYPDGGIARFRLYGKVIPVIEKNTISDFASVLNGGVAIKFSDQHFGTADNLLLPGRGHDMSDGWETARSREVGHTDWVIIRLGTPVKLNEIIVDTAHFRGNFPQKINVKATNVKDKTEIESSEWDLIVPDSKTKADQEHSYKVESDKVYSHIKLTIIPDGGVKRIRAFGVIE
ncbi:unnamed protein product [Candida verbasci]|uniref:allantoicase n=1 Tax=Candida verbasci TaxID=1227364 RepID=A0A9W4X8Z4_9ASCO|nr:unnamed protein product [Candida verbasci]